MDEKLDEKLEETAEETAAPAETAEAAKPDAAPQPAAADYSRYMGTLNRIYRRNNNPQKKRPGSTSPKNSQKPAGEAAPEGEKKDGKKDYSFPIAVVVSIAVLAILWAIKNFPF